MSACLTQVRTDSTPYPSYDATRCTVPCSVPSSARSVLTIRTAAAFSSDEYRRVVGFPDPCLDTMTPSSFPRSGASNKLRALHTDADDVPVAVWRHQVALGDAARRMRCAADCVPQDCSSLVHQRYGSRSQVVSASRRTKYRTGWSFTGLTRTVQRRLRRAWWESQQAEAGADAPVVSPAPLEDLAARSRRELVARGWAAP